jgi:hypothetical protein
MILLLKSSHDPISWAYSAITVSWHAIIDVTYIVKETELGRSERLSMCERLLRNILFSCERDYSG